MSRVFRLLSLCRDDSRSFTARRNEEESAFGERDFESSNLLSSDGRENIPQRWRNAELASRREYARFSIKAVDLDR